MCMNGSAKSEPELLRGWETAGGPKRLCNQPSHLPEKLLTLPELIGAVEKLKLNKPADESGMVVVVLKHTATNFAAKIYTIMCFQEALFFFPSDPLAAIGSQGAVLLVNFQALGHMLSSWRHMLSSWRRTLFTMVANIGKQHWSQTFGRLLPCDCSTKLLLP